MQPAPATLRPETAAERRLNCLTHGLGVVLATVGLAGLLAVAIAGGGRGEVVGTVAVYGVSLVLVYLASTLFHACPDDRPVARRRLRVLDHAAIYLLIAGTYTPFLVVMVKGAWGWGLLATLWGLALAGIVLKVIFIGRYEGLSTVTYLAMAWIGLVAIRPFVEAVPAGALGWILAGGIFYTGGVGFFVWERLRFSHAIWHVFVLGGSACHFVAVAGWVV